MQIPLLAEWLPALRQESKRDVLNAWWAAKGQPSDIPEAYLRVVQQPADPHERHSQPLTVDCDAGGHAVLRLTHTGVSIPIQQPEDEPPITLQSVLSAGKLNLTPTVSLLANFGRIFAACAVDLPLLLVGAPGIGKTAVVQQVATLTGHAIERINLSASSSIALLFGSVIPQ